MNPSPVCLILGSRATGKTTLIQEILAHCLIIQAVTIVGSPVSPRHAAIAEQCAQGRDTAFHDGFSRILLSDFVKRREKAIIDASDERRAILVLEDCLHKRSVWSNKDMQSLFMNGRHLRTTLLISMQFPMAIPQSLCA
jgi:molybdopterin-guanine dinucleotide biosynthesis protein